jgi:hypothetical protein
MSISKDAIAGFLSSSSPIRRAIVTIMAPRDEDPQEEQVDLILPATTGAERTLEGLATFAEFAPELGGVVGSIFSGMASQRRQERIRSAFVYVLGLITDVSNEQKAYVRSEDFEDLVIETLGRVEAERSEEKRQAYGRLLASAVRNVGEPGYDEQLRFLRVLEELQPDHLRILRAMVQEPERPTSALSGSYGATLERRLPDISKERLVELVQLLTHERVSALTDLYVMMTADGAADLRSQVTHFGQRFISYVLESPDS